MFFFPFKKEKMSLNKNPWLSYLNSLGLTADQQNDLQNLLNKSLFSDELIRILIYGDGCNGKSVFINILSKALTSSMKRVSTSILEGRRSLYITDDDNYDHFFGKINYISVEKEENVLTVINEKHKTKCFIVISNELPENVYDFHVIHFNSKFKNSEIFDEDIYVHYVLPWISDATPLW